MKLSKLLKFILSITVLALVYIHMQMEIIDLAYQGNNKQKLIRKLSEENGNITYTVLTLRSANHLGYKMLADNSDMKFADPVNIMQLSMPNELAVDGFVPVSQKEIQKPHPLLSLLSFGAKAEAKGQE